MAASCSGVAWTTRSGPSATMVQVVVGHQGGDLDDGVAGRIEPGHLEIDPGQHGRACYRSPGPEPLGPVLVMSSDAARPAAPARPRAPGARLRPAGRRRAPTSSPAPTRCWPAGGAGRSCPPGWRWPSRRATPGSVLPRSGLALRHGVTCLNTPGLIDSGYRGELQVVLVNHDPGHDYAVSRGDRIAQLVIVRVEEAAVRPGARAKGWASASGAAAASATPGHDGVQRTLRSGDATARRDGRGVPVARDADDAAARGRRPGARPAGGHPLALLALHPLRPDPPGHRAAAAPGRPPCASGPSGCRSGCTTRSGSTTPTSSWTTISAGPACRRRAGGPSWTPSWPPS